MIHVSILQVYLLKACQVPQSKLHLKLLQATKVIITLVKEKKQLTAQLKEVSASLDKRKTPPISKLSSSAAAVQQQRQEQSQSESGWSGSAGRDESAGGF